MAIVAEVDLCEKLTLHDEVLNNLDVVVVTGAKIPDGIRLENGCNRRICWLPSRRNISVVVIIQDVDDLCC